MDKKNKKQTEEINNVEPEEEFETESEEVLDKELNEFEEKYKRALADYQNLEKRVREERISWIQSASRELLLKILPVLDTLVLASQHSDDESLKISVKQFLDVLKNEGVEKIPTVGKDFNPHTMEAVTTAAGENGKVLQETRAGYTLHDRVLRPAQVIVGKEEK